MSSGVAGTISSGKNLSASRVSCNLLEADSISSDNVAPRGSLALLNSAAGSLVMSATGLLTRVVHQFAAAAPQTITLPATTAIISALGGVGRTVEFVIVNTGASTVTLTAADGSTTIIGSTAAVAATTSRRVFVTVTSSSAVVAGLC